MDKKIYVITPNVDKGYFNNKLNLPQSTDLIPNLSALFYASKLKQEKKNVQLFDYYENYYDIIKNINKENTECIYLFLGYANYNNGLKLYKELKQKGLTVILSGVYNFIDGQNFSDYSFLKEKGLDYEKPIVNMAVTLNYDLIKSLNRLFHYQNQNKEKRMLAMVSQYYGCPKKVNCFHCSSDKIKTDLKIKLSKTPEETIKDIIKIQKKYQLEKVVLGDLMITDKRLEALARSTGKNKLPELRISTAANYITTQSIKSLKKINCREVFLGIESYNENLIRVLDKTFTVKDIDRAMRLLYKNKIIAHISLVLGIPGETKETIEKTVNFIKYWKNKRINGQQFCKLQISILTPVPGSALYEVFKSRYGAKNTQQLITGKDWIKNLQKEYLKIFLDKEVAKTVKQYHIKLSKISETKYV